jgi:predicted Fe-Mo cluster-binding NifX family protein
MVVCVPVAPDGTIDPSWGRAARVAVAHVESGVVGDWQEFDVRWDELHDEGTEGGHHARIARFLRDHSVDTVVAGHMGQGMLEMMPRMGVTLWLGASGDARGAVATVSREAQAG